MIRAPLRPTNEEGVELEVDLEVDHEVERLTKALSSLEAWSISKTVTFAFDQLDVHLKG
jgi:hypothetical protein